MPPLILPESLNTFDKTAIPQKVTRAVYESISDLKGFPNIGRPGRVAGTRELALAPLPFIVVYRVKDDLVEIARILHGAQRWP
jgi:toxin ParE1/3/4